MSNKKTITIEGKEWELEDAGRIDDDEYYRLMFRRKKPERSPLAQWQAENIVEPEPPGETSRRTAEWLVGELLKTRGEFTPDELASRWLGVNYVLARACRLIGREFP